MKQSHLGGRCRGLRPSQQRQLERLSHRRHPEDCGADLLSLERLADLVLDLEMALLSLIHISEPTRLGMISYAVFCLKKKKLKV